VWSFRMDHPLRRRRGGEIEQLLQRIFPSRGCWWQDADLTQDGQAIEEHVVVSDSAVADLQEIDRVYGEALSCSGEPLIRAEVGAVHRGTNDHEPSTLSDREGFQ
jgi:hypothetical protein